MQRRKFKRYLERNLTTNFANGSTTCPIAHYLKGWATGTTISSTYLGCISIISSTPLWAKEFIRRWDTSNHFTGAGALEVLNAIPE